MAKFTKVPLLEGMLNDAYPSNSDYDIYDGSRLVACYRDNVLVLEKLEWRIHAEECSMKDIDPVEQNEYLTKR